MAKIKTFTFEECVPEFADLSKDNEYITETAGFIPLDVKFKRFEQAGIAAQFQHSEFTANDFRELYANPDFELYPDDEIEEIEEKIRAYQDYRLNYMKEHKLGAFSEGKSPSQQAERASVEQPSVEEKETSSE